MSDNHQTTFFFKNDWITTDQIGTDFVEHSNHLENGVTTILRAYSWENGVNIYKSNQQFSEFQNEVQKARLELNFSSKELLRLGYLLLEKNRLKNATIQLVAYALNGRTELMGSARECKSFSVKQLAKVTTSFSEETIAKESSSLNTLRINREGHLTGGVQGNFFLVKDGILYTPKLDDCVEPGQTRSSIIEGAMALGYPVIEKSISTQDLSGSEAAFFSSGENEMSFIEKIDNFSFKTDWRNTIAHDLMLMLRQLVLNDNKNDYSII